MDPHRHSAVAATIYSVICRAIYERGLDPVHDKPAVAQLAVLIAQELHIMHKINLGRRK